MSDDELSSSVSAASYSRSRKHSYRDRSDKRRRSESRRKKSRKEDKADSDDDSSHQKSRKRQKKERKKERKSDRKKHKKKSRKRDRDGHDSDSSIENSNTLPAHLVERNHALAEALCSLFDDHPALGNDLPPLLIRLAGGASFDLSQMTDDGAARGLARVFECLAPFGVEQQRQSTNTTAWVWKNPAGPSHNAKENDLVLIRVVRATLDQIGLTHEAVLDFENPPAPEPSKPIIDNDVGLLVDADTKHLLDLFANDNLAAELAGLCQIILDGEVVALDDLPDEKLRMNLESILVTCGLEKSEMDVESDDESSRAGPAPTGFGLPEARAEYAQSMIRRVWDVCSQAKEASTKKRVKGPIPLDQFIANGEAMDSSDDEAGPLPVGASESARAAALSQDQVKALAARRAKELACAKEGVEFDPELHDNVRDEWMVVPGKFDFLGTIKSGQPIRTRQFEAKGKLVPSGGAPPEVDAATRAEIHAIRNAYESARGRSLMEEHQDAKKVRAAEQKEGNSESWQWNRDKDIDAGRRVDKDALNMILGGAGSDLKDKFQRRS